MAWTVSDTLRNYLIAGGSLEGALTGGDIIIRDSEAATLATCVISNIDAGSPPAIEITFAQGTIPGGIEDQDAASAVIRNSSGQALLTTDDVGGEGAELPFDVHEGWNAGDKVTPGVVTLTFALAAAAAE